MGLGSSKKRKRGERIFRLESFCRPEGSPALFQGSSFQENMRALLGFGEHEVVLDVEGFKCWSFLLELRQSPPADLKLLVLEEMVEASQHRHYPNHFVGWGQQMICSRRFHIVLPSKDMISTERLTIEVNGKGSEKSALGSNLDVDHLESHLMHGILHSNGLGHLICVNGIEGGSQFISGRQIMDLWDQICTALQVRYLLQDAAILLEDLSKWRRIVYSQENLSFWTAQRQKVCLQLNLVAICVDDWMAEGVPVIPVMLCMAKWPGIFLQFCVCYRMLLSFCQFMMVLRRKVSLIDVARKGLMELRLIHGLAYGESWFGRWGYRFGNGSFGITQQMHQRSLEALQSFPLCLLIPPFYYSSFSAARDLPSAIAVKYQAISTQLLLTFGDLFRFMMELNAHLPVHGSSLTMMDFRCIVAEASCRWSMKRVEMAAHVVVQALKRSECRWVTRQEVRDIARTFIGDTGLLDFVLKSLGNHVVGNYIVRRMVNPVTKVLEYCLQDISSIFPTSLSGTSPWSPKSRFQLTGPQLMKDMFYLYHHILTRLNQIPATNSTILGGLPVALNIVLDTKHLVKDYSFGFFQLKDQHYIYLNCTLRLQDCSLRELHQSEMIGIPSSSTVVELKREVETYYKSTYLGLKNFVAEEVLLENEGGCLMVNGSVVSVDEDAGEVVMVEWGNGDEVVNCSCGAKAEDGERMVNCDICEVWLHSRCVKIPDGEELPGVFLCNNCEKEVTSLPFLQY
ncbi:PHD finger protein MALE STERILITY 1 [Apostasia shenzhenica]|uniref:PHD finger protein MALE STERILITY 1 n=1 Tax=Apostasia shenzhenica TaxID=1088818 RepID=A0A2I0B999_9ASPA|nr:PHD finger protein MALE STERILITY 1 [Apostasia shenzhenica]